LRPQGKESQVKKGMTVLAAIGLTVAVPTLAGAHHSPTSVHKQVRYVRAVTTNGWNVDNDPSGPSGGDLFGSTGDLRHAGGKVGTYSSACTGVSDVLAQCQATFIWNSGDRLQLAGQLELQPDVVNHLSIVGGTGKYRTARGEATIKQASQDGAVQRARLVIVR
jgi:hypothetical protein